MDLEPFLKPVDTANPVGEWVRYEPVYDQLEEARRDENIATDAIGQRELKRADWDRVVALGTQILAGQSKDLEIAAFVTEALAHQKGLPGIVEGLELLKAVQGAFWDKAHPDSGDPELRRGVYEFLDNPKILPLRVRSAPLTYVQGSPELCFSYVKYREAVDTDQRYKQATTDEQRDSLEGRLRGEAFDTAAAQTPRSYYVELADQVRACLAAVEALNQDVAARWPATPRNRPPQLSETITALEAVEKEAKKLLGRKPAPPPETPPPADQVEEPEEEESAEPEYGEEPSAHDEPEPREERPRPRKASKPAAAPTGPEEALARVAEAAHYLRQADPADPTPYLVLHALAVAGLYGSADPLGAGDLPAPPTEIRQRLYQAFRSGDGDGLAGLLEESEQALGRPEGRGWLDAHFYSVQALEGLGHEGAARACKALLGACLRDHEGWPKALLGDGTPCAAGPTQEWIEREFAPAPRWAPAPPPTAEPAVDGPAGAGHNGAERDDPWETAQSLARARRLNEAIALLGQSARQSNTGRERFLRTLQQAELCLDADRAPLALPLLELLAQRIDEFRLDQWEDSALCTRVLARLYRCLEGQDDARAAAVYNRLCQIDPGEALLLRGH